jgi:osmoprotectant transport system ATP-binding protein
MDEPFGAVDPVTRQRLQDQFLELQSQLHKTIVFVTHDIDEAAKLGDRIAVLSRGGVLEQYDTPSEILGRPASSFVAQFVGSDRGLRRLAVVRIEASDLASPPLVSPTSSMSEARSVSTDEKTAVVVDGEKKLVGWVSLENNEPGVVGDHTEKFATKASIGTSMRDALSQMLEHDVRWIPVLDENDVYLGVLTPNRLHAAMRRSVGATAAEP